MPRVDCFLLVDSAQVANGKLYILGGGWARLTASSFPVTRSFETAIRVVVPWTETNRAARARAPTGKRGRPGNARAAGKGGNSSWTAGIAEGRNRSGGSTCASAWASHTRAGRALCAHSALRRRGDRPIRVRSGAQPAEVLAGARIALPLPRSGGSLIWGRSSRFSKWRSPSQAPMSVKPVAM